MTNSHPSGSAVNDRALSRAMFLYGFAMFMLVYMVQPLLPRFVSEFSIAPAIASQAADIDVGPAHGALHLQRGRAVVGESGERAA